MNPLFITAIITAITVIGAILSTVIFVPSAVWFTVRSIKRPFIFDNNGVGIFIKFLWFTCSIIKPVPSKKRRFALVPFILSVYFAVIVMITK